MRTGNQRVSLTTAAVAIGAALQIGSQDAMAANPVFQDFVFANLCTNPTGALNDRCTEWVGTVGDLSGDSETSLNPSQSLSNNHTALERALNYSKEARERGDELHSESEQPDTSDDVAVQFGRASLLFQVRGSSIESDKVVDVDAERGFESDYYGTSIGFDYRVGNRGFVGVQLGFDTMDQDFVAELPGNNFNPGGSAGSLESDTTSLSLTGSFSFSERAYFVGSVGFADSEYDIARNSIYQQSNRDPMFTQNVNTVAEADGDQTWATFNFGFSFGSGAVNYGPYFGVTTATSEFDAYTEREIGQETGFAMSYSATERDSLLSYVGFSADINRSTASGVLSTQFRIEYQHESDRDPNIVNTSYVLDQTNSVFALESDVFDSDQIEVAFGIVKVMRDGWQPYFDIAVLTGNDTMDRYRWAAGFRKEF